MRKPTHHRLTLPAIALSTFGALPAVGQTINEEFKLVASDAAGGDIFGVSVAVSRTTTIIGALFDDDAGDFSGSAYLFDTETGLQLFKLTASDAAEGDQFGTSVAISRTTAIVGSVGDDDEGSATGSVYIFDTDTGIQLFKLTASDAEEGDLFGISVAISLNTAVVGAIFSDDAGPSSGSAYLFDTVTGLELFKLTASDAQAGDFFGASVAIFGTTAIIGAPNSDDAGSNSGSVYLFDTLTGLQIAKLTSSEAASRDFFGHSVAIAGTTAIVGLYVAHDAGSNRGSAFLFDTETGLELFKLTPSDAEDEDHFGTSVAITGTTAIVGAFGIDDTGSNSGSAYLFDTKTGLQIAKLIATDAAADDQFGGNVAISNTTAIVGASANDDAGASSGSAYVFDTVVLPCPADVSGDGQLNFFDISRFLTFYQIEDPIADFNGDGLFNFFDISAFLKAFAAGCP